MASDVHQLLKISQPDCDKLRKSGSHYVSGGEERLVKLWDYVTWLIEGYGSQEKKDTNGFYGHPKKKTKASNIGMEQKDESFQHRDGRRFVKFFFFFFRKFF